jgi:endonuclease YncB( thermonuclease family)
MWKESRESKSDVTRGKRIKVFGLFVLTVLSLALAQNLVGRASVVDGDTLEIQRVRIRLWGIDAVESSQTCLDASGKPWPCGRRAAFALADFLGQRTVRCERRDTDRYGRVVAVCYVGNIEINRWLVEQGWALAYVEYGGSYSGTGKAGRCHPAYPTVCIPPPPPDLDCKDIPYRGFKVLPPDPHRLDRDGDGIGCER